MVYRLLCQGMITYSSVNEPFCTPHTPNHDNLTLTLSQTVLELVNLSSCEGATLNSLCRTARMSGTSHGWAVGLFVYLRGTSD